MISRTKTLPIIFGFAGAIAGSVICAIGCRNSNTWLIFKWCSSPFCFIGESAVIPGTILIWCALGVTLGIEQPQWRHRCLTMIACVHWGGLVFSLRTVCYYWNRFAEQIPGDLLLGVTIYAVAITSIGVAFAWRNNWVLRFSLRQLMFATTYVAVLLGAVTSWHRCMVKQEIAQSKLFLRNEVLHPKVLNELQSNSYSFVPPQFNQEEILAQFADLVSQLSKLNPTTMAALVELADDPDFEIRCRARLLLQRIDQHRGEL